MTRTSFLAVAAFCIASSAAMADPPASPTPPGVSPQWLDTIQRDIRAREYRFSATDDGAFSAPNRARDLRGRVAAGGIQVTSRTKGAQAFALELRLARMGREGSLAEVPPGEAALRGERVEIRRAGLSNRGVVQQRRARARAGLDARCAADGRRRTAASRSCSSSRPPARCGRFSVRRTAASCSSTEPVRADCFYGELVARDAKGVELASRLAVATATFRSGSATRARCIRSRSTR